MNYLLDTNAWISCFKSRQSLVALRLASVEPRFIHSCSIVWGELYFGALRSNDPASRWTEAQTFLAPFQSFAFDDIAAEEYGTVRAHLTEKGNLIGPNDLLIAAIALANNLTLVTHNTAEFGRVQGLKIEDWQA